MAYSLWLAPERRQALRIQKKIEQLAREHGAEGFAPHLTVSSGIKAKPSTEELLLLARRHRKPSLAALRVEHSSRHYQCMSLGLRRDRALMALRADALQNLGGQQSHAPYDPHISLLYAKLSASRRAALAKRVPASLLRRCKGSKLQLVLTEGQPRDWELVEQVELEDTP